jgi:hypothetical protein
LGIRHSFGDSGFGIISAFGIGTWIVFGIAMKARMTKPEGSSTNDETRIPE